MRFNSQRNMVQVRKSGGNSVLENRVRCGGLVVSLRAWSYFESTGERLGSLEARRGNLADIQFLVPRKKIIET